MRDKHGPSRRSIDHPDELERMVRQIVDDVDPVAIFLFGSRARGDADEDSDYDLMVVLRNNQDDRGKNLQAGRFHIEHKNMAEFYSEAASMNRLANEVIKQGILLWPTGEGKGALALQGPCSYDVPYFVQKAEFLLNRDPHSPGYEDFVAEAAENIARAEATCARAHVDRETLTCEASAARQRPHEVAQDLETRIERLRKLAVEGG